MNRPGLIAARVATAAGATGAGSPPAASHCGADASAQRYRCAVRAIDPTARAGRDLGPGQTPRPDREGRGVVAAVETAGRLEGGARLLPAGARERVIAFDRSARAGMDG